MSDWRYEPILTASEFIMGDSPTLGEIQAEVLALCRGRTDLLLFGAQAVNAYSGEPRTSQDVDLLSPRARELAEEIRDHLQVKFRIASRVREVKANVGYRVYQQASPKNRHLVDVRQSDGDVEFVEMGGIRIAAPAPLVAMKVIGMAARRRTPKGALDLGDLRRLLVVFPDLKSAGGKVSAWLGRLGADEAARSCWLELVAQEIEPDADSGY